VQELPGGDYRSIAGLSRNQMQVAENACRDAEIRRIAQILLSDMARWLRANPWPCTTSFSDCVQKPFR
jgi:hypothetical protein